MSKIRNIGLDVHKNSIVMAVADSDGGEPAELGTIPNDHVQLLKRLRKLGRESELRVCYEAGPTGYGLYRELNAAGIKCVVIAPSLVPTQSGNRVKTDRRDAARLARFLRSGDLTYVHVPDETTEGIRDLTRAREDAKALERTVRHQLGKFLLRNGRIYANGNNWTQKHLAWIRTQKFVHPGQEQVLVDYLKAVEDAKSRVERLTECIREVAKEWKLAPRVTALQALRGVQFITAVTLCAELFDFKRFGKANELMAYLGLTPSEYSSGESRRQGGITKTGNGHVRKLLVESAWSYRYRPAMSDGIRKRNQGVAENVRKIAWRAQERLHGRYNLMMGKGKSKQKTVVAVARELAGFIWAIGQEDNLLAG